MITIFTTPKPFDDGGKQELSFRNAVGSWKRLWPTLRFVPEIIVFGGQQVIVEELGAKWIGATPSNENGLPYIDGMFALAQTMATNDILLYANDDIILLPDLLPAVWRTAMQFESFLMIGRRWDVDVPHLINFGARNWEQKMRSHAIREGRQHSATGKDYFAFRRPLGLDIPPLFVGRPAWDNWMVLNALGAGIPVVDVSSAVMAIHQNHDYSHNPGNVQSVISRNDEFLHNMRVGGLRGHTSDATWAMSVQGRISKRGICRWNQ